MCIAQQLDRKYSQVTNYQYQPSLQFTSEHMNRDIDPELSPVSEQVVAVDL